MACEINSHPMCNARHHAEHNIERGVRGAGFSAHGAKRDGCFFLQTPDWERRATAYMWWVSLVYFPP